MQICAPCTATPTLGEDEAYQLDITRTGATLKAATVTGVLHGLETFLQLIQPGPGFQTPTGHIADSPRFAWRGLMLDCSRHFLPVEVIERNLDAMAVNTTSSTGTCLTIKAFAPRANGIPNCSNSARTATFIRRSKCAKWWPTPPRAVSALSRSSTFPATPWLGWWDIQSTPPAPGRSRSAATSACSIR